MTTLSMFAEKSESAIDSTDRQNTPRDLAHDLGWFDLDPCSNPDSHIMARRTYSLEAGQDGLALPWEGSVWCNGEYSNPLPWCERLRAHQEPWASLWKLDTTTAWFRCLMAAGASWAPFRERLRFERPGNCGVANFVSVLVWKHWQPPPAIRGRLWV
jgi:hypothetical protein